MKVGRMKAEAKKALDLVDGKMPVRMKGFTILVPQVEIERLVREYAISHIKEEA